LNSRLQALVIEYGAFSQFWPQFEKHGSDRRLVGLEVELIGFHASELNHVDPRCPKCRNVRAVLFEVAHFLPQEVRPGDPSLMYDVDSHSNSILCLPALGNRAAVSVSVYISWSRSIGHSFEMDLSIEIKTFLNRWGIHQR